jgi:hypothetical protein
MTVKHKATITYKINIYPILNKTIIHNNALLSLDAFKFSMPFRITTNNILNSMIFLDKT